MRPLLLLAAVAGLSACQMTTDTNPVEPDGPAARVTLNGTVAYRERMALPQDARVQVTLSDVSLMDVAAPVLAETEFSSAGRQVPIPFTLSYDPARIKANGRYAVSARITDSAGKLMWITDTHFALPAPGAAANLMLVRVAE